jgi:radical SAM superfamily enzyme
MASQLLTDVCCPDRAQHASKGGCQVQAAKGSAALPRDKQVGGKAL